MFLFLFAKMKKVVEIEIMQKHTIQQTLQIKGVVHSHKATTLCAKKSGVLGDIFISSGNVKKGDKIAALENASLREKFEIEKRQANRATKLHKDQALSSREYEQEYQQYLQSKDQFEQTQFVAPFAGILGVFHFSKGDYINAGDPLVAVYDDTALFVKMDLPGYMSSKIKTGQTILIDDKPFEKFSVQKMLDEKTHMLPAQVETPHLDKLIGEIIDVDVIVVKKDDILSVPAQAIFMENQKNYVYVMADARVAKKEVKLGIQAKERIEILEGLKEGDSVIIKNPQRLFEGMEISA